MINTITVITYKTGISLSQVLTIINNVCEPNSMTNKNPSLLPMATNSYNTCVSKPFKPVAEYYLGNSPTDLLNLLITENFKKMSRNVSE